MIKIVLQKPSRLLLPLVLGLLCHIAISQESRNDSIISVHTSQIIAQKAMLQSDYSTAIVELNKANELAAILNDPEIEANVLLEYAKLNYYINNYETALYDINKVIEKLKNTQKHKLLANAYTFAGFIQTSKNNFEASVSNFKAADALLAQYPDDAFTAENLLGKGKLALRKKEYPVAVNYLDAAIPMFNDENKNYNKAYSYILKSEALLYLSKDDPDIALRDARLSLSAAENIIDRNGYNKLQVENLRLKTLIALEEGDFTSAQNYLETHYELNNDLNKKFISAVSQGVDSEVSIIDLTDKIAKQKLDLDKQQKSISFTKMTTGLSIALIIILSLLTLSLYKNNNLRAKANDLLQDKNTELELAKEKAEKASLAKAQFLSTITHELRTPMYAVTGLTHLMMEANPTPEQKEHLNSLKFSGEYLLSLINNILDLNKLDANKVEVEKTTFNLNKRIKDVLVALKKSADDKNNKILLEYDESIPNKLIGDPLKLSQILINLVGNSVKFTENGTVVIRIQKLEEKKDRVTLHFEVEDDGVGVSKKKQKSIFETFSQASLQVNRKFGGTGLGLSIVKNLLELLDSKIHLESQLGHGSKFWFNINFGVVSESIQDKQEKEPAFEVDYAALEGKKVLVVEDNKINQMITRKILEKQKFDCTVTDNGLDAVSIVKDTTFDVILMDIHMPGISGVEATKKIRQFNKEVPIIALTAVTIDENLDSFFQAGFDEIIPKPFKPEEFFEKIQRSIQKVKKPIGSL